MNKALSSEYGQIKIHRRVVAQIAETATREIKGVKKVGVECYGIFGRLLWLIRMTGTKVLTPSNKEVKVIIPVATEYNANAVDIAYEIQRRVIAKLLSTLNMDSVSVDVKVKRIEGR